jgi:DNA-binding NarL/FixJ family response regulator
MSSSVNGIGWQDVNSAQDPSKTSEHQKTGSGKDTVKVSEAAQVMQLSQQGFTTQEIALNLGLTLTEVTTYLGISSSNPPPSGQSLSKVSF